MHNRSSIKTAEWTCNLMPLWQPWQAKQDQYKNCWGRRCELISSWQLSPVWDCLPRAFNLIKFYFRDVYHAEINTTLTWPALLNSNCANVGHISWSLTSIVGKPANKCDKLNEGWHIRLWLVLDIILHNGTTFIISFRLKQASSENWWAKAVVLLWSIFMTYVTQGVSLEGQR